MTCCVLHRKNLSGQRNLFHMQKHTKYMFLTHLNLHYCKSAIVNLIFMGKCKRLKRVLAFMATLLVVYNVNTYSQNINSATNGLSKANDTTVSMGGTLTQNTDIDLGGTFKIGYKKGSLSYLNILNNGNVGLGVANPLAQFHTSGSMRFDLFKNNATLDSLITTDADGNLVFKSIANYINASNGITYGAGGLKLGGTLTEEATSINGNNKGFGMYDLQYFDLVANGTMTIQGGSVAIGGAYGNIGLNNDGFSSYSNNIHLENIDDTDSIMLVQRLGFGYAGTNINHELKMNIDGLSLTRKTSDPLPRETFLFSPEGRAYFRRYSTYNTDGNWPKFEDEPTTKALYLDETTGMVKYGSISGTGEGGSLNFTNGLTKVDPDVKLGGLLTDVNTNIEGDGVNNNLNFLNLNSFQLGANEFGLTGNNSAAMIGGNSSITMGTYGIYGTSAENSGITFKAPIHQKLALAAQIDYSYGMTPVDYELWLDTVGMRIIKTSPFLGDTEYFRFGLDGRAYLRGYSNYWGAPGFQDAGTRKALYIDSATGQVMYGDILAESSLEFGGGLTREGNRVKIGGTLDDYTQLLVTGDPTFSIYTEDDRNIGFLREEEGREWLVQLKNQNSEIGLQRNALGLNVRDFGSGNWSSINLDPSQTSFSLTLDGGFRKNYITQNYDGAIHLGTEASDFGGMLNKNVVRLDTTGFAFSVMDNDRFSIKNDGTIQLFNYLNNPSEDLVLTTDVDGNLKFKSLSESIPSLTFGNGLTASGDSIHIGGSLLKNTQINLFDNDFRLHSAGTEDSVWLNMGIDEELGRSFSATYKGIDWTSANVTNKMSLGQAFSLIHDNGTSFTHFYTSAQGLQASSSSQGGYGINSSINLDSSGSRISSERSPGNWASISAGEENYPALRHVVEMYAQTGGQGGIFTIDSSGFKFKHHRNLAAGGYTTPQLTLRPNGIVVLEQYRNNANGDSVLTTDANGNLKFKSISGLSGGVDSAWAYDSINIYNRNAGNVGIGTLDPTAKFHTIGSVRFESFKNNLQGDSVLTTDAEGNLKFVYLPYGSGGTGGEFHFSNGIEHNGGNVRLGGQLTDSVKINLQGNAFQFNNGPDKVIDISPDGNVGIGTAATDKKLTVRGMSIGRAFDSVGWGDRLWFNEYGNQDGIWMSRYNLGTDNTELRVSISDDGAYGDKFQIGHFMYDNPTVWQSTFVVQANGVAGVGTADLTSEMSIGKTHGNKLSVGNSAWAKTSILSTGWDSNNSDYTDLLVPGAETNTALIRLNKAGNVGIGTLVPDALYKLSVNGKIRAKGLRVQSSGWADFVFEPDYNLMSLPDLEKFIRNKKHLPGIATAAQVMREGNDVGETQVQLLQKIEELTLYIIGLNKQVKDLEDKNKKLESQQSQIGQLQQQLDDLRKLILNK